MRSEVGEVLRELRALSTAIDRVDQVAAARYGLNRTDMRALDLIGQADSIAPTELARRLGFTTGGVTTVIDRLEQVGYVRRVADRRDRRRLTIERTDFTAAQDAEVFGSLIEASIEAIEAYSDAELSTIRGFLERIGTITSEHAAGLAQPDEGQSDVGRRT